MTGDPLARYTEFDGLIEELFPLATKAMREGRFEKALAYATIIQAAQVERDVANDGLKSYQR